MNKDNTPSYMQGGAIACAVLIALTLAILLLAEG